mgnify:CR=1 FL=1
MGENIKKLLKKTNPARIVVFIIFLLYGATMVYALFWAVTASLNEHTDLILNGLALPKKLHFENYLEAFRVLKTSNASFGTMLWNSVWLTVLNSLISLAAMTVTGYVLGRYSFVGKKVITVIMLAAMLIPVYGNGSATLRMYMRLGMYDSPLIVLKSASALGAMTLVIKTFFQNIPMAYQEAARVDGASRMRIFLQVHLPMVKPSLFAIFILQFIGGWNDYTLPIYYMPNYPTISSGLYIYETLSKFTMNKPVFFAGVVMCAIPPMILFSIFSDKLMKNVSLGGLK